jgi:hypothetical protein
MILHPLVARGNAIVVKKIFKREGEREREREHSTTKLPSAPNVPFKEHTEGRRTSEKKSLLQPGKTYIPGGGN